MPSHHNLLLLSNGKNPLPFENPLEKFDNLSHIRTEQKSNLLIINRLDFFFFIFPVFFPS